MAPVNITPLNEPTEAFPYTPPTEDTLRTYPHIFELRQALPRLKLENQILQLSLW